MSWTAGQNVTVSLNLPTVEISPPDPWRMEPEAHRLRCRRQVPAHIPLIHEAQSRVLRSPELRYLRAEQRRQRPCRHPGIQLRLQSRRLHRPIDTRVRTFTARPESRSTGWGGDRVADNYSDFYDGTWDDEDGNNCPDTSQATNYPWTGCKHDGTDAFTARSPRPWGPPAPSE